MGGDSNESPGTERDGCFTLPTSLFSHLCVDFNPLHRTTLYRIVDHVTFCMNEALDDMISWPSSEMRQQWHGRMSVCTGGVAVLDGTHCPIQAPSQLSNLYYSGYKCKHTQNYLCCVNYMGIIVYPFQSQETRLSLRPFRRSTVKSQSVFRSGQSFVGLKEMSMDLIVGQDNDRQGENYLAKETAIKQPPQSSSSACSRLLFMQNSTNSLQTAHTITAAHVQHRCRVVLF